MIHRPPIESDRYIIIQHATDHKLLLRGCALVTPYRAGFEDCLYLKYYANPFTVDSPQWHKYDRGYRDSRTNTKKGEP